MSVYWLAYFMDRGKLCGPRSQEQSDLILHCVLKRLQNISVICALRFNKCELKCDNMVSQIYPSELQLNKANTSDTKAAFLDLHLSISNDIVSSKIYDKRDDFDFEIVNFPF